MACVLVLGGGGREHSLARALSASPLVARLLVLPGNPGTAQLPRTLNIDPIDLTSADQQLERLCHSEHVQLVVVGPEQPLADGVCDRLRAAGVRCFGPGARAARIETDKVFAKRLMSRLAIPTPPYRVCSSLDEVRQAIADGVITDGPDGGCVVKACGLAGGKGVVVAESGGAAVEAAAALLQLHSHVLLERRLLGEEVSLLAFCDGLTVSTMPPAQDHKRLFNGDRGPNTGGMGAVAPSAGPLSAQQLQIIAEQCLQPIVDEMRRCDTPYVGVLYAGLMVTSPAVGDDVSWHVLEYNCRLGDPETQVLLPLLATDLYALLSACVDGRLGDIGAVEWRRQLSAVAVVACSEGYPHATANTYARPITGPALDPDKLDPRCHVIHAGTRLAPPSELSGSEGAGGDAASRLLVTAGGRVLAAVAVCESVACAQQLATICVLEQLHFSGKQCRTDIGARAAARHLLLAAAGGATYRQAGVDIEAGERFVDRIGASIGAATSRLALAPSVGALGGFGAVFNMTTAAGVVCGAGEAPRGGAHLLVAGADGVGTKVLLGQRWGHHRGLGQDLVAMCVNDIICHGARPLFFLDYIASSGLSQSGGEGETGGDGDEKGTLDLLVEGMLDGCREAECALVGGETADMPGVYRPGVYDLAGVAVGHVIDSEGGRGLMPAKSLMKSGDVLLALHSNGLHSNGFSLVRHVLEKVSTDRQDTQLPEELSQLVSSEGSARATSWSQLLLAPTRVYWRQIRALLALTAAGGGEGARPPLLAAAHITGGGLATNVARVLPSGGIAARLDMRRWTAESCCRRAIAVIAWLALRGPVSCSQLLATFNLGLGMVLVVAREHVQLVTDQLQQLEEPVLRVGQLVATDDASAVPLVSVENVEECVSRWMAPLYPTLYPALHSTATASTTTRVAVLVSGVGSTMAAVVQYWRQRAAHCRYSVCAVVSSSADAPALRLARAHHVPCHVLEPRHFASRQLYDQQLHQLLSSCRAELVVLAGFMRVLSAQLVAQWRGRLLNIHPSLLPAFPGLHVHRRVLAAGVCVSGCTVHVVDAGVDTGPIVAQRAVPVLPGDCEDALQRRVQRVERWLLPRVLQCWCSGQVAWRERADQPPQHPQQQGEEQRKGDGGGGEVVWLEGSSALRIPDDVLDTEY